VQEARQAALDRLGGHRGNSTRKQVLTCIFGVGENMGGGMAKTEGCAAKIEVGVAKIWGYVAKFGNLFCTIQQSPSQRSDVAGGS
jgi:hypothetical protein